MAPDATREEEVHYPVATPTGYWAVIAALSLLALVTLALVPAMLAHGVSDHLWLAGLAALAIITPGLYFFGSPEYRTGGRRAIVLSRGSIVVPDARGVDLVFVPERTKLVLTRVRVVYRVAVVPVASVPRGTVIELRSAHVSRRISTLTLLDAADSTWLLRDLELVLAGRAPLGPRPTTTAPAAPRDALDDRLDDELRR